MTDAATQADDSRRWVRDLSVLLALPAMWVDHEPDEIANGLLSVLFGVLQLDGAYARFQEPGGDGIPLEVWRPTGEQVPAELTGSVGAQPEPGARTVDVDAGERGTLRVTTVPLALPWETGLVIVSSRRPDFPTELESHMLRVAIGQAAIAIHTARRLGQERIARAIAESTLRRQDEVLRALVEDAQPSLAAVTQRIQEAARLIAEPAPVASEHPSTPVAVDRSAADPLSHREGEVLGLLAQGLSNKEIAGVLWLSDRTVERHITSIYRKIGVARRSEATAFALRHGLG